MSTLRTWNRREFLALTGITTSGLLLGLHLTPGDASSTPFIPSVWINLHPDNRIVLWVREMEMGQGVRTALPMILADELEAPWEWLEVRTCHTDPKFGNLGTGGSSSVRTAWMPMRRAGAAAREMLRQAAARRWNVSPETCRAEQGYVTHLPSGKKLSYGELTELAATLSVPENPPLKSPEDFRYIGRRWPKVDTREKVTGQATYGLDVRLPGMLFATVVHCPYFGGRLESMDPSAARAIPGVVDVVEVPPVGPPVHLAPGVAVVATSTWAAMKGREALRLTWTPGPPERSEDLRQRALERLDRPARVVRTTGTPDQAFRQAARIIEATYELPYLAHAPLEPMNATARIQDGAVEIWAPIQTPSWSRDAVAQALELSPKRVTVYPTLIGGGFGRRLNPDLPVEAALVSRALGGRPVQVVWTREEDMQHDYYRPANFHRFRAALDAHNRPMAWFHRMATPSINAFIRPDNDRPEASEVPGAADLPYGIPNIQVEYALLESVAPRGWLRSVEHSFNGFVVNAFMDELAEACGEDPVAFRLRLLDAVDEAELQRVMRQIHGDLGPFAFRVDRFRRVLEQAAEKAGWHTPLAPPRGRGVAVHWSFRTYVAEVAEVTALDGGEVRLDRIVCVVDCGQVVNPRIVEEQMEGGILYGLTQLKSGITLDGGRVVQSNFHDFDVLRMPETPEIEVHIVESSHPPSGTGEPGLPPALAAVTNAIYRATGRRIRRLPLEPALLGYRG